MNSIRNLKIATIIAFLVIIIPGKIAFINIIVIFLGAINFIFMIGVEPINFDTLLPLLTSIILVISTILFFKKTKNVVLLCVIVQNLHLIYMFKVKFLKYWYYTLPTSVYLILSLTLLYFIFVKKEPEKVIDS